MDAFTESDLQVGVGVYDMEETVYALRRHQHWFVSSRHLELSNLAHKFLELLLREYAISIVVYGLELANEEGEEFLVLTKLKVEDTFEEGDKLELSWGWHRLLLQFGASHIALDAGYGPLRLAIG